jgi:hypothetical protein
VTAAPGPGAWAVLAEIGPLLAGDPGELPVPSGMLLEVSAAQLPRGRRERRRRSGGLPALVDAARPGHPTSYRATRSPAVERLVPLWRPVRPCTGRTSSFS